MNPRGTSTDLMNALTIETGPGPSVGFLQPDRQMSQDSGASSGNSSSRTPEGYETVGKDDIVFPQMENCRELGRGTYGQVIEVIFRNTRAALKSFAANAYYKDVKNEAEMISKFDHKNIIKLYALFRNHDEMGLLLELMPGQSLDKLLHEKRQIKYYADHAIAWARQCIDALEYIHANGYLHRDVKPSNMLLSNDYIDLKLCDFGTVGCEKMIMTNNIGTDVYMSPEVKHFRKYDQKCDIYSFGISLWEILTREHPEENQHLIGQDVRPKRLNRSIPLPLTTLIERCWHTDPEERPEAEETREVIQIIFEAFNLIQLRPLIDMTTSKPAFEHTPIDASIVSEVIKQMLDNHMLETQPQNVPEVVPTPSTQSIVSPTTRKPVNEKYGANKKRSWLPNTHYS